MDHPRFRIPNLYQCSHRRPRCLHEDWLATKRYPRISVRVWRAAYQGIGDGQLLHNTTRSSKPPFHEICDRARLPNPRKGIDAMRSLSNLSITRSLTSNKKSTSSLRDKGTVRPLTPPREIREPEYSPSPPEPPRIDLSFDDGPKFSLANLFSAETLTSASDFQGGVEDPSWGGLRLGESSQTNLTHLAVGKSQISSSPVDKSLPQLPDSNPGETQFLRPPRPPFSPQSTSSTFSEAAHTLAPLTPAIAREETSEGQSTLPPPATLDPPANLSTSPRPHSVYIPSVPIDPAARRENITSHSGLEAETPAKILQHCVSISVPPPDYSTLPLASPSTSFGTTRSLGTQLSPQIIATRNNEKQALRDAWAKQDAERQAAACAQQQIPFPQASHGPLAGSGGEQPHVRGFEPTGAGGSNSGSGSSGQGNKGASASKNVLPPGMDIRDALAKCEDPSLGWSLQFWVTIADPQVSDLVHLSGLFH